MWPIEPAHLQGLISGSLASFSSPRQIRHSLVSLPPFSASLSLAFSASNALSCFFLFLIDAFVAFLPSD
jgi:hypothetical protein